MVDLLRLCYILATHCDVTRQSDWGTITKDHSALLKSNKYTQYLEPVLETANKDVGNPVHT